MTRLENTHAENYSSQDFFVMHFGAFLAINNFSGAELDPEQELAFARQLIASPQTRAQTVTVEVDPVCGYTNVASIVEANDEADALDRLSFGVISGLAQTAGMDPECLELLTGHVAYEEQMRADMPEIPPLIAITAPLYMAEGLSTFRLDDETEEEIMSDAHTIFYSARHDVIHGVQH